jgi:hypothetical protein
VTNTPMTWIALSLPFMLLAVFVALGPIIWAVHHEARHGRGAPERASAASSVVRVPSPPDVAQFTVCAVCSAMVVDGDAHAQALHELTSV